MKPHADLHRDDPFLDRTQTDEQLLRFRAAMDMSGDAIYLVDRATMRFVDVNQTACTRMGYSRDELLKMGPQDLLLADRKELEQKYEEVIAAGAEGTRTESSARTKDGRKTVTELHRRAMRSGDGWIIVSIARDITRRKRAERAVQRIGRMFSALSATNEAILRTKLQGELYQQVCDAAVRDGQFVTTAAVFTPDPETRWAKVSAVTGTGERHLREARVSMDQATPEGRGLIGTAFRTLKSCVSNDFLNDERSLPWRGPARESGILAAAAVPLLKGGDAVGVLLFCSDEVGAFDDEIVKLLERMAENVSFALESFARDAKRRRAKKAMLASEEKYRLILESIEEAYYEVDLKGNLVFINPALCRLLGYPESELIGMNNRLYQAPGVAASVYTTFNDVYRTGVPAYAYDWEMVRKDGSKVLVEGSVNLIKDGHGRPAGFRGMLRDVTARRRVEQALRESEARFRSLTELSSDWYWEQDAEFRFSRFEGRGSGSADDKLRKRFLGKRPWEFGHNVECEGGWDAHRAVLHAREPFRDQIYSRLLPDGTRSYTSVSGEPMFDATGRFAGYRGVGRDITERKRAEERIEYLATHDGLTGLPNRVMFSQMLNLAIGSARRYGRKLALLFIDLDRFKIVNDTLGHEAGDALLKQVSARLRECLRASDVVARLGGDEFVVLVQEVNEAGEVAAVARKILSAVIEPVVLGGQECRVTASVGISMYPADAQDEQSLMKNADIAMYLAKEEGKNNFQFYSSNIKTRSLDHIALETSLRDALERSEFFLHYQPKLDLWTGAISGVEALLRWQNPKLGLVSPAQFIPVAEETGIILPIGKWVLKTACEQNVAWQREGLPPVCMAVNLSPRQFFDPDLLPDIAAALLDTGMAPELLELEITESMVMHNTDRAVQLLGAIKRMGVRLAIDDFGTGHSSLAQLKRFPIDTLKLDRSFIRDIPGDSEDSAIAQAIIAMGRSLSLTVVAEGVETPEQLAFLRQHACDQMQGYYFSKPIAPERFAALLGEHDPAKARAAAPAGDPQMPSARPRCAIALSVPAFAAAPATASSYPE